MAAASVLVGGRGRRQGNRSCPAPPASRRSSSGCRAAEELLERLLVAGPGLGVCPRSRSRSPRPLRAWATPQRSPSRREISTASSSWALGRLAGELAANRGVGADECHHEQPPRHRSSGRSAWPPRSAGFPLVVAVKTLRHPLSKGPAPGRHRRQPAEQTALSSAERDRPCPVAPEKHHAPESVEAPRPQARVGVLPRGREGLFGAPLPPDA